jgi:hypothetical protein
MSKILFQSALVIVGLVVLSGCDMDGTLQARRSVTLLDKKGRAVELTAGQTYKAELGKDDGKVKFDIKVNGKEKELRLALPPGAKLPKYEGELMIPASHSRQPVDFYGVINTDVYEGSDSRGTQSCTDQARVRVCKEVPTTRDGRPATEERCDFELRTVSGTQDIVYHDKVTTTSAVIQLLVPNTRDEVARFDGSKSSSDRIVTWTGRCETPYDHGGHGGWPDRDRPGRGRFPNR